MIASKFVKQITNLENHRQNSFSMKSIGDINYVLGLKFVCNGEQRTSKLSQETYAKKIPKHFRIVDYRPISSSVTLGASLEVHKGPTINFPYSQAVKSIMYFAMGTRPDLAFNIGLVLCFASNLCKIHVKAVKKILRYLQATIDIGLVFGGNSN